MSGEGTLAAAASFCRHCDGCSTLVPLEEWQDGPLGCNDCRRRLVGVSIAQGKRVILEFDDSTTAARVFQRYSDDLARVRGGMSIDLAKSARAA